VHLPGGQPAGQEGGQHALLGQVQPVRYGRSGIPSHDLMLLLYPVLSCKTKERL